MYGGWVSVWMGVWMGVLESWCAGMLRSMSLLVCVCDWFVSLCDWVCGCKVYMCVGPWCVGVRVSPCQMATVISITFLASTYICLISITTNYT